jgi:glycosyltransferase involved in cell wall biosynthesis
MKPLRILHVVGSLARGGVETWLMQVLRRIDRTRFSLDFLTLSAEPQAYDEEARALGSAIMACPGYRHPPVYARNFRRIVEEHGPYDVLHCHFQEYSGFVLWLAQHAGIPVRIAHSHSDTMLLWARARLARRLYIRLMQRLIGRCSTVRLAVSQQAAALLFDVPGRSWQWFPCGIDLAPFAARIDPAAVRSACGLAHDAFVVGHVGRFVAAKNHRLLIDMLAHLVRTKPEAMLLLVGDGPLLPDVQRQVASSGLQDHVTFAGSRPDVAHLMRGAMDVCVLPSFYEGLGLAGIEAQAAGLPCLFSNRVPAEADVVAPLVRRLSLAQPPEAWAAAALDAGARRSVISQETALAAVQQSGFDIQHSVQRLENLYSAEAHRDCRA